MSRAPRIPRYAYTGVQRYFLTICAHNRVKHFTDAVVVSLVLDQFFYTAREQRIAIPAYCVMPDHVHLLVDGESDDTDLKQFVKLGKQRSGYRFGQQREKKLWQEGYYDHVLREEEKTADVIFYIITNPLRTGLVQKVTDYPFWGSSLYSRKELLAYIGCRA